MVDDYLDEGFASAVRPGIHMVEDDGNFNIALSLYNPSDEEVSLKTMDTNLFNPVMEGRGNQSGYDTLWSGSGMAGQSVTYWGIDPESRVTRHYVIPNYEDALEEAEEWCEEFDFYDDPEELMDTSQFNWVDPEEVGLVGVKTSLPTKRDLGRSFQRNYDLRHNMEDNLDDELPPATEEHLSGQDGLVWTVEE